MELILTIVIDKDTFLTQVKRYRGTTFWSSGKSTFVYCSPGACLSFSSESPLMEVRTAVSLPT